MKHVMKGILLLAFLTSTAWAEPAGQPAGQGYGNGQDRPTREQRAARMQQALGLSDAQMRQIREIRQNGGGRDEIRAVLNDEQRAILDEHRANRQRQGKGSRGPGQGRGPGYGAPRGEAPPAEPDEGEG